MRSILRACQVVALSCGVMRRYRRHARAEVAAALDDTPIVVIVGPRQAGKSTLAEQIVRERGGRSFSLDDAETRAAALADPKGFVEADGLMLIDEFQKAPMLLDQIKLCVDRRRSAGGEAAGMFLLTGSANVWATLQVAESLAGRAERIQLWPLSQGEMADTRERFLEGLFEGAVPQLEHCVVGRKAVSERVVRGGYPEMVARDSAKRQARWARNYVDMVLERDARDVVAKGRQLEDLPRLLALAAARAGCLVEPTSMGREIEMKRDSVRRYLHLLEVLFLVRRAPAWSANIGQQLIKSPKLWMPDTGLSSALLRFTPARFEQDRSSLPGGLFESFVAGEVLKQASWSNADLRLLHFRTAGGREVDIVVERSDGAVVGIEVKLTASPTATAFSGLAHLRDVLGDRFRGGVLVHTGEQTLPFGERLWGMPVAGLWAGPGP